MKLPGRAFWASNSVLWLFIVAGCPSSADLGASAGAAEGGQDEPAPEPGDTPRACESTEPLMAGDAPWSAAPFTPPAPGDGSDDGDEGDDADDGSPNDEGGLDNGFIDTPDGGAVSFECDLFAQDCPAGEKCMPWANDGGPDLNATRCSPVSPDPGAPGDPCTVEGSAVSGIDDCDIGTMCWDVDRSGQGTCIAMCTGSADAPLCDGADAWCYMANDGAISVCLPGEVCEADGACRCMCPADPDCRPEQCAGIQKPDPETILAPQVPRHEEGSSCPETMAPIELYMSNDDSNSQASPILARRTIREGRVVAPQQVRIHEFMNYYDFSQGGGADTPARVAIEMRRTDADAGQFTLMLYAAGRTVSDVDRPPMNLVFSLDTSGSMAGEPIELLKETMRAIAASLRTGDVASIVTWSDTLAVVLDGHVVSGPSDPALLAEIDAISSGGGTNLNAGLVHAYDLAGSHFVAGGVNRVILISDGGANLGITDADLIGSAAADADGEGVYLVGVGVSESSGYNDALMDAATDAGKGAYVFIDSPAEAHRQFEDHFLSNVAVAARNVRMKVTLPWYFGIQAFHGEEYSSDPTEVEPQHLSPNDVMAFHQIIGACDPSQITECDAIAASVDYVHPLTGETGHDEITLPLGELVQGDATRLRKADAIVGYAKALIVIGILSSHGEHAQAATVAGQMSQWLAEAATALGDAELAEVAALMSEYETVLSGF